MLLRFHTRAASIWQSLPEPTRARWVSSRAYQSRVYLAAGGKMGGAGMGYFDFLQTPINESWTPAQALDSAAAHGEAIRFQVILEHSLNAGALTARSRWPVSALELFHTRPAARRGPTDLSQFIPARPHLPGVGLGNLAAERLAFFDAELLAGSPQILRSPARPSCAACNGNNLPPQPQEDEETEQ